MIVKDIINDIYSTVNSANSVFGGRVERGQVIKAVKKFVRKLAIGKDEKFVRLLEISPDNTVIDYPEDAVDIIALYYSVCIKGKGDTLLPLYVNNKLNTSSIFLRDNNNVILEDADGLYLRGSGSGSNGAMCDTSSILIPNRDGINYGDNGSYSPTKNVQGGEISVKPQYSINKEDRFIQFSTTVSDDDKFVVEYIYNPFMSGNSTSWTNIEIDEYYFEAVEEYVYYQLSKIARNISDVAKQTLRQNYIVAIRSARTKVKAINNTTQLLRKRALNIKP